MLQGLLMLVDGLAFAFPVPLIAYDILQILITLDIVGAHDIRGVFNHLLWYACLPSDLDGERRAGLSDGQLEEGLHFMTVVEHRPVHYAWMILGKVLQVLVMGGYNGECLFLPELLQHSLCNGTSNGRLRTAAELVD